MTKRILERCLNISKKYLKKHSRIDGYKHYSFIIQNNRIIEWGTNISGAPLLKFGYKDFQMIHAENTAYKKAKGLLDKSIKFEVINIRLNNNGNIKISKPCNCCFNFLKELGCSNIWYSKSDGEFKKIKI